MQVYIKSVRKIMMSRLSCSIKFLGALLLETLRAKFILLWALRVKFLLLRALRAEFLLLGALRAWGTGPAD